MSKKCRHRIFYVTADGRVHVRYFKATGHHIVSKESAAFTKLLMEHHCPFHEYISDPTWNLGKWEAGYVSGGDKVQRAMAQGLPIIEDNEEEEA